MVQAPVDVSKIKPGAFLLPGLRRLRNERDLSMRELAEKAGVAPDTVWQLENLRRGAEPKTRRKLAYALKTTVKELRTPDKEVDNEQAK